MDRRGAEGKPRERQLNSPLAAGKTLAETVNAAVSAGVTREGVLGVTYGGLAAFLLSKRIDASHLKAAQIIRGRIDRGECCRARIFILLS